MGSKGSQIPHDFGGSWTAKKLEVLKKYLEAYMTIFTKNAKASYFQTIYIDVFAGKGYRNETYRESDETLFEEFRSDEVQGLLSGSAKVALDISKPFSRYLFIEKDSEKVRELENLRMEYPSLAERIEIVQDDANDALRRLCREINWQTHRAVVFMDPYGMQVEWSTIEAIAETQAIDLWILFPLGVAVNRLLTRNQPPKGPWAKKLDRFFGTQDWRTAFYRSSSQPTLFKEVGASQEKVADWDKIGRFFMERLRQKFSDVSNEVLSLRNSKNVPLYLLCFAAGNPKGSKTAIKIAKDIIFKELKSS